MQPKRTIRWHIVRYLRALTGLHNVDNGTTCHYDLHDYPHKHGGDGYPSHFHEYHCRKCGQSFGI